LGTFVCALVVVLTLALQMFSGAFFLFLVAPVLLGAGFTACMIWQVGIWLFLFGLTLVVWLEGSALLSAW
jgi:hypothetical protein